MINIEIIIFYIRKSYPIYINYKYKNDKAHELAYVHYISFI